MNSGKRRNAASAFDADRGNRRRRITGDALERAKGFEPSTPTLAKLHYTYSIIRDSTLFL